MSDAHLGVQFDYWIEMADVILVPFAHKLEAWSQPSRRHSGYASSPPTLPPRTASVMLDSVASQSVLMLCQVQIDLANVSLLLCTGTLENGSGMRLSCDRICILKDGPNLKGSTRGFTIRACTMSSVRPVERCCFALLVRAGEPTMLAFNFFLFRSIGTHRGIHRSDLWQRPLGRGVDANPSQRNRARPASGPSRDRPRCPDRVGADRVLPHGPEQLGLPPPRAPAQRPPVDVAHPDGPAAADLAAQAQARVHV